jgi:glycerate 2-kinase
MLKILIAPDKFKGSLTAQEVCQAVEEGILKKYPKSLIMSVPLADGGEGTFQLLASIFKASVVSVSVMGPTFTPVAAHYGLSADGATAFIEMAIASGLELLTPQERNPLHTTTYGTGQLISDAINRGVNKIVLGIGGSATNDAGIGMATALGYVFFDSDGNTIKPVGENLVHIQAISHERVHKRLKEVSFVTLCDVDNPLHGALGAASVFGPQKGATPGAIKILDDGLVHFEKIATRHFGRTANFPGAGAAGGLGAGAVIFLNAALRKGIDYVMEVTDLRIKIANADLVITGEGKIDTQSLSGKVVMEVARIASGFGKNVVAVCGKSELSEQHLGLHGIQQCLSLNSHYPGIETMKQAYPLLCNIVHEKLVL